MFRFCCALGLALVASPPARAERPISTEVCQMLLATEQVEVLTVIGSHIGVDRLGHRHIKQMADWLNGPGAGVAIVVDHWAMKQMKNLWQAPWAKSVYELSDHLRAFAEGWSGESGQSVDESYLNFLVELMRPSSQRVRERLTIWLMAVRLRTDFVMRAYRSAGRRMDQDFVNAVIAAAAKEQFEAYFPRGITP